jgi:hypothetical protein
MLGDTKKTMYWFRDNYGIPCDKAERQYVARYMEAPANDGAGAVKADEGWLIGTGKAKVRVNNQYGTDDFGIFYVITKDDGDIVTRVCDGIIEPIGYVYICDEDSLSKEKRIIIKITPKT